MAPDTRLEVVEAAAKEAPRILPGPFERQKVAPRSCSPVRGELWVHTSMGGMPMLRWRCV
jgi:hypothetical protein